MSRSINKVFDKRAFTIVELVINTLIVLYVIAAGWSVYIMVWRWWYETAPQVEVQRVARVAMMSIVEGRREDALGSDQIGSTIYRRRNGISETTLTNANPTPASPVVTSTGQDQDRIDFRLEPDLSNTRSYAVGTVSTGVQALYYNGNIIGSTMIKGRIYITCDPVSGFNNLYKVTVRVEKDVHGTRLSSYTAVGEFSDHIFMRNI